MYTVPGAMLSTTCILSYLVLMKITMINENRIASVNSGDKHI